MATVSSPCPENILINVRMISLFIQCTDTTAATVSHQEGCKQLIGSVSSVRLFASHRLLRVTLLHISNFYVCLSVSLPAYVSLILSFLFLCMCVYMYVSPAHCYQLNQPTSTVFNCSRFLEQRCHRPETLFQSLLNLLNLLLLFLQFLQ